MQIVGVLLVALGVAGLLYQAAWLAWNELRDLSYRRQLDEWAEDVREW